MPRRRRACPSQVSQVVPTPCQSAASAIFLRADRSVVGTAPILLRAWCMKSLYEVRRVYARHMVTSRTHLRIFCPVLTRSFLPNLAQGAVFHTVRESSQLLVPAERTALSTKTPKARLQTRLMVSRQHPRKRARLNTPLWVRKYRVAHGLNNSSFFGCASSCYYIA